MSAPSSLSNLAVTALCHRLNLALVFRTAATRLRHGRSARMAVWPHFQSRDGDALQNVHAACLQVARIKLDFSPGSEEPAHLRAALLFARGACDYEDESAAQS